MAISLHIYIKYGNLLRFYSRSRKSFSKDKHLQATRDFKVPAHLGVCENHSDISQISRELVKPLIQSPYDVLGLKNTCSQKDVKKAYIKLCKELHPDMRPGDASQHKKFVELNDAYTALINSENKKQNIGKGTHNEEDFIWLYRRKTYASDNNWESEDAWYKTKEYQEYFHQRDKKHEEKENYRKANLWVVSGCFILMILGSILYAVAYRYAEKYKKDTVDERSKKISENYDDVRKNALEKGSMEQLSNLQKKWNN